MSVLRGLGYVGTRARLLKGVEMVATGPVVAVLDTMWGDRAGNAPRYFHINPHNHSGKRLYSLLGPLGYSLLVTNACRELVTHAGKHGKPDPVWLAENLTRLNPRLILVCGAVARKAFQQSGYKSKAVTIHIPHLAARCWSKRLLASTARRIQSKA